LSLWRSRPAFPGGNLPLATMIGHGVPEVTLYRRQVQITGRPSMMHSGASPRSVLRGNMGVIEMTSATSLKIGGASCSEHHPHHGGLYRGTLLRWEKVDSVLWRGHSVKYGDQTCSRLATSTGMTALATLKNSFRCIRPLLRPLEEMIG
jgi:hypothetical protein